MQPFKFWRIICILIQFTLFDCWPCMRLFFAGNCVFSTLVLIELIDTLFYSLISEYDQLPWVTVTCLCSYMINTFIYLTKVIGRRNQSAEIRSSCLPFFPFFLKTWIRFLLFIVHLLICSTIPLRVSKVGSNLAPLDSLWLPFTRFQFLIFFPTQAIAQFYLWASLDLSLS